ncbi:mitochondrial 54S ribosomal uL14m domain-containing protein [Dipodascopsis tothii]|uniref:mitochondrial 54S ribosomal uL14m domain-containing protein n=1 Tax=Dipodascopsis tothii TaxID=44089 RepID=UPI0034CF6E7D
MPKMKILPFSRNLSTAAMIYLKSILNVIDNSGAIKAECINILKKGNKGFGQIGDRIVCVVKETRPPPPGMSGNALANRPVRGEVRHAVIVRTKKPILRKDGTSVRYDDNACVLVNKAGDPIGTRIFGVVGKEVQFKNYNKICALAPKVL